MQTFNSFQELLNSTAEDVASCAMPSALDNAARTAMEKAGVPTARTKNTMGVDLQKTADVFKCWASLLETNPEQALMELSDDNSEINKAQALKFRKNN